MLPRLMGQWMAPGGGQQRGEPAPGFTGFQHCAAVWEIDKSRDILLLRIDNLVPESMIFNVSFVAPIEMMQAMKRAVSVIHGILNERSGATSPSANSGVQQPDATLVPRLPHAVTQIQNQNRPSGSYFAGGATSFPEDFSTTHWRSPRSDDCSQWASSMLFPTEIDAIMQLGLPKGPFRQVLYDMQLNHEQKKAVDAIQSGNYGTLPFLIFGPPGTSWRGPQARSQKRVITCFIFWEGMLGTGKTPLSSTEGRRPELRLFRERDVLPFSDWPVFG